MTVPRWRDGPDLPPRPSMVDDRYRPTRHEDRRGTSSASSYNYPSHANQDYRRQGNGEGSSRDRDPQQPVASTSRLPNRPNVQPPSLAARPRAAASRPPPPPTRAEDHQPNAERQDRRFRTLPVAPPALLSKPKPIAIPTGPRAQRGRPPRPPPPRQAAGPSSHRGSSGPHIGPSKAFLPPRPPPSGSSGPPRPDTSGRVNAMKASLPPRPDLSARTNVTETPLSLPSPSSSLPARRTPSKLLPWEKPLTGSSTQSSESFASSQHPADQGFVERSIGPGRGALPELPGGLPAPTASTSRSKEPLPVAEAGPLKAKQSIQPNGTKRQRADNVGNEHESRDGKKARPGKDQSQAGRQKERAQEQASGSGSAASSKSDSKADVLEEQAGATDQSEDELEDESMTSVPGNGEDSVAVLPDLASPSIPLAASPSRALPQASSPINLASSSDGLCTPPLAHKRIFVTDNLVEPTLPSLMAGTAKQMQSTVKAEISPLAIDLISDDDGDDDDDVPLSRGRGQSDRPVSPATLFNGRLAPVSQAIGLVENPSEPTASTSTTTSSIWRLSERVDRLSLLNFAASDGGPQKAWSMRWLALIDCKSSPALLAVTPRGHTSIRYAYDDSYAPTRELREPSPAATVSDVRKLSKCVVGIASGSHNLVGEGAAQVSLVSAEPRKSGGIQARSVELADRPHVRGGATCIAPFLKLNNALTFVTGGSDGVLHGWAYRTVEDNDDLTENSIRTCRLHALHTQPVVAVETTLKGLVFSASHKNKRGPGGSDVIIFDGNETKLLSSWHTSDLVSGFTPAKFGKIVDMTVLRNDYGQHKLHDPSARNPAEPVMTFGWYHSSSTTLGRLGRPIYHKNSYQCLQGCPDGKVRVWDLRNSREVLEERSMSGSVGEPLWDSILIPPSSTDSSFADKGPGWFTLSESAVWRGSWESS